MEVSHHSAGFRFIRSGVYGLKSAKFILLVLILIGLFSASLNPVSNAASQPQPNDQIALQVIARLNAWRLDQQLAPLKFNPILRQMALDQASYLLTLSELPGGTDGGDIHLNAKGELPPQRAIHAPYNWPSYGRPDRTAIGENAAVGSVDFALFFWSTSDIHRKTALNPGYREVGAAAFPYPNGYLIIVDFGSRPDVLPAFISLKDKLIYLTNEQYKFKSGGSWMQNATHVQFFDENDQPYHSELYLWTSQLALPDNVGKTLKVVYTGGKSTVTTVLNVDQDQVWLPDTIGSVSLSAVSDSGTTTQTVVAIMPTATPTLGSPVDATTGANPATNTPTPTVMASNVTAAATATTSLQGLVIYYDSDVLTLLNNTGKPVDLTLLNFKYGDKYLGAQRWNKVVAYPMTAFPAGHCLQVRNLNIPPVIPPVCKAVRSVLQFTPDRLFWTQADFDVTKNTTVIVTCKKDAGLCVVPWTN